MTNLPDGNLEDKLTTGVSIDSVASVLGAWQPLVHWYSVPSKKDVPAHFRYTTTSFDALTSVITRYGIKPKVFFGDREAAKYLRENSFFITAIYILNPPETNAFYIYQILDLQLSQNNLVSLHWKGRDVQSILKTDIELEKWLLGE